jgi:hypothetical protein
MKKIEIAAASPDHIAHIANHMREADRLECMAMAGKGPHAALTDSLAASVYAWTGLVDNEPICIFGVSPRDLLAGVGSPWLLGTHGIGGIALAFLRRNQAYVRRMLDIFPVLENYVDVRNHLSIRWLGWLGFSIEKTPVICGAEKRPFYRFGMKKEN